MTEPLDLAASNVKVKAAQDVSSSVKVKTTKDVVAAVNAHVPGLDQTQISAVIEALNKVREGADLGVVMRDPVTGSVAHRVDADGILVWRVSEPGGGTYTDMQPTLPWEQVYPVS